MDRVSGHIEYRIQLQLNSSRHLLSPLSSRTLTTTNTPNPFARPIQPPTRSTNKRSSQKATFIPELPRPYYPNSMSWMGWFGGGRNDHKESARNAIVELRSQLLMLEKREDHIQKQIDEETRKAKANATSNQRCKLGLGQAR
jgi:hypothetical protein